MHQHPPATAPALAIDPVCGMRVDPAQAAATTQYGGKEYYFCAIGCKVKFERNPEAYLAPKPAGGLVQFGATATAATSNVQRMAPPQEAAAEYTCPMHPDIRQRGPASCPTCGMALEPAEATLEED